MDFQNIPLVFNINKPIGLSSFDVVRHFKKNLNFSFGKIGHFGTLDPFANGVLLVGIQGAQKLNDYVHELLPKTYCATGKFGVKTVSGDLTSPILLTKEIDDSWKYKSREEIDAFLRLRFLGDYWQSPHSISASKFEGQRLYQHALQGRLITKEKVKREIFRFEVTRYEYPFFDFIVTVSSGTYIRSLFEEIAVLFDGYGALSSLSRSQIGSIGIGQSLNQDSWPKRDVSFDSIKNAMTLDQVLILDNVLLTPEQAKKYLQGMRYPIETIILKKSHLIVSSDNYIWVYNINGVLLGLAQLVNNELCAIFNLPTAISQFC